MEPEKPDVSAADVPEAAQPHSVPPVGLPGQAVGSGDSSARPSTQPLVRASALREELAALSDVVAAPALVDVVVERAFEMNATDVHFDPQERNLRVRIRIDGMLHDVLEVPRQLGLQIVSRSKLMANMDIAEKRLPQDGHFTHQRGGVQRDVRVASGPTAHGERLVLRLASEKQWFSRLEDLGMRADQADQLREALAVPYGLILCVGPVGSGKTTTMYSCLQTLNEPTKSVASIEDPIEHTVRGVNQMQVDARIGVNFATGLRALMRQDPNVMMVGEIRDAETAHTAVRAALTGVLLLSTMHANDAPSAVDVFHEFDVPPMLVADALVLVMSQRLLRKICLQCCESYEPNEATRTVVGIDPGSTASLLRARGCDACFNTGYLGRTGVFEMMRVDKALRSAILHRAPYSEIRAGAVEAGMIPLEEAAAWHVCQGITTVEEMHRVVAGITVRG